MIDLARDVLSRESLLGLMVVAAGVYLVAGPISERVAERKFLPQCIAGGIASADAPVADDRQGVALDLYRNLMREMPLGSVIDGMVRKQAEANRAQREARARRVAAAMPDRCRCRMSLALAATRADWALWVGTLKLYEPQSLRDFASVMARVDAAGICKGST